MSIAADLVGKLRWTGNTLTLVAADLEPAAWKGLMGRELKVALKSHSKGGIIPVSFA